MERAARASGSVVRFESIQVESIHCDEEVDVERVCFTMRLKPERVEEYLAAHEVVWPEMLDALRETGWTNYSLYVDREAALVVGVLETDDFEGAIAAMNEREVNARWQATMAGFFAEEAAPDSTMKRLTEYFFLK
ncbi:MAG: L-rhamnose mutarotase [Actinobacteria bacterium]|nr:L-rhamnose mutarotase [Actinomycetota bacterium]